MAWVTAKPGESIDSLLRRFKKAVENSGILADLKKHEFYEKPSIKRKRKQAAARKRALKREKKLAHQRDRAGTNKNFKWNKDRTKKIPTSPPPKKFTPKDKSASKGTSSTRAPNTNTRPNTNRPNSNTKPRPNTNKKFSKKPNYTKRNKS